MIRLVFAFLVLFMITETKAQNINGLWEGEYSVDAVSMGFSKNKIYLSLTQTNDSIIQGVSTSYFFARGYSNSATNDDMVIDTTICIVKGTIIKNRVYINETEFHAESLRKAGACFQEMKMKYSAGKKYELLRGNWSSATPNCGQGYITFKKINQ